VSFSAQHETSGHFFPPATPPSPHTAGELEALGLLPASHPDSAEDRSDFPFPFTTTTTNIPRTKIISAGSFLTKISNLSTTMAKAGLAERVERVCAACSPSATFSWLNAPSHHCFCQPKKQQLRCRMRAFRRDSVKTRDFCDVHDYHDLQNTRQHFGAFGVLFFFFFTYGFLDFCFIPKFFPSPSSSLHNCYYPPQFRTNYHIRLGTSDRARTQKFIESDTHHCNRLRAIAMMFATHSLRKT